MEYFDNAIELDKAVWGFVKHEFKNKSRKEASAGGTFDGAIPYRYWDTHGKVLHGYAWDLVRQVRLAYQIAYPRTEAELEMKKKHLRAAIGLCWNIHDALLLTAEELYTIDIDKLDRILKIINREIALLDGVLTKSKVSKSGNTKDSTV